MNIIQEPLIKYLSEKEKPFGKNEFAHRFRNEYPKRIEKLIVDKNRYKVIASTGKGNWTDCPWIAILDLLITKTPQSGYYPVLVFNAEMSGVYLSLNQGITEVKENYKSEAKKVLKLRASDYRAKLNLDESKYELKIDLKSKTSNAKLYESGNIVSKFYSIDNLPSEQVIEQDIIRFISLYDELTYLDSNLTVTENPKDFEIKKLRMHFRIERNSSLSKKVKNIKGYTCEVCNFNYEDKYGDLGKEFIEAHHLEPIANLEFGKYEINIEKDFAVLCSSCHRMIHRLDDPSNLIKLKEIITATNMR